ncbi:hypothetical protein [Apilactobacillus quenuiae]|uniref:hypothetical protein n=1 Tax=Apilactobacillus quenuiae TaxID=2008377 RepID=UPI000D014DE5|nr:hypothetical protein [Apilactobacillus quenuiae]
MKLFNENIKKQKDISKDDLIDVKDIFDKNNGINITVIFSIAVLTLSFIFYYKDGGNLVNILFISFLFLYFSFKNFISYLKLYISKSINFCSTIDKNVSYIEFRFNLLMFIFLLSDFFILNLYNLILNYFNTNHGIEFHNIDDLISYFKIIPILAMIILLEIIILESNKLLPKYILIFVNKYIIKIIK